MYQGVSYGWQGKWESVGGLIIQRGGIRIKMQRKYMKEEWMGWKERYNQDITETEHSLKIENWEQKGIFKWVLHYNGSKHSLQQ